ncbi:hypothetical protein N869_11370, partial [Cellulomonas bogoriensis 69B4 = DSM 16987]
AEGARGPVITRWRREGLTAWREHLASVHRATAAAAGGGTVSPHEALPGPAQLGRLHAALADVLVRDAVLIALIGEDRVADQVLAGHGGPELERALRRLVDPGDGRPPAPGPTAAARLLLEQVVAHAPRRAQSAPLTLLAVLAWWSGDGARASVLCERALVVDPEHRLAVLVEQALGQGMGPGWLRRPVPSRGRAGGGPAARP